MHIFTRKTGEAVTIGDDITITILENDLGQVRIGIKAPKDMPILRDEIYRRIIETGRGELVEVHRNT